ncbi:MAG: glycogen synthase GlgA [Gammaproteobacteria bacterium]|nr:glycogen synthase GlgA [Gammaproteobacteria bacterium]
MRVLFAASEAYPLIKTGGLGDVIHGLPMALNNKGVDVRLVLPAYRSLMNKIESLQIIGRFEVAGANRTHMVQVIESRFNGTGIPLLLIDVPELFDRDGGPYLHLDGHDWPDNAERFSVFSRAVAELSMDVINSGWSADIVHCHDWQTGLVPAFLQNIPSAPKSIFTIHNLAYAGLFNYESFASLGFPPEWWSPELIEFYDSMSMLKAGILFADEVTTVSPRYAYEITTPEFGHGMDGVLRSVEHKLVGILNGIDHDTWDPQSDVTLAQNYSINSDYVAGKRANKKALFAELGLSTDKTSLEKPLLGFVGRLVEQKGIDLILELIPQLMRRHDLNIVILGSGHEHYEIELTEMMGHYPENLSVEIGYSERRAHLIEAAADLFLMPSRFEPCGLNQLYSLCYGTLPIVHYAGGLADSVVDATVENIDTRQATGFHFYTPDVDAFYGAVERALKMFQDKRLWNQLIETAMAQDFSWEHSSEDYISLYNSLDISTDAN